MSSLKRLPRTGSWEVELVGGTAVQVEGQALRGLLVVVERVGGDMRHAVPVLVGQDLAFALAEAARSPTPSKAGLIGRPEYPLILPQLCGVFRPFPGS